MGSSEQADAEMNRILIIGCGSIGRRHIRALISLGERNIAAYRTEKGGLRDLDADIKEFVLIFRDETDAFAWRPTHVIISNPTKFHLNYLEKSMKAGAIVFVEKPLADCFYDIEKMPYSLSEIKRYNGIVGFNMRYHSLVANLKGLIDSNQYGKVISAHLMVGHYLPFWHPYEDFRKSYAAIRALGGGALRTLCHEIDLAMYLFGKCRSIYAKVQKLGILEIDVDDTTDIIAEAELCKHLLLHMDFLNPLSMRRGSILFEEGLLEYDYVAGEINFTDYNGLQTEKIFSTDESYKAQYIAQMKHFLSGNSEISCSLEGGIEIMKIIDACEKSNETGRVICLG